MLRKKLRVFLCFTSHLSSNFFTLYFYFIFKKQCYLIYYLDIQLPLSHIIYHTKTFVQWCIFSKNYIHLVFKGK